MMKWILLENAFQLRLRTQFKLYYRFITKPLNRPFRKRFIFILILRNKIPRVA